MAADPDSRARTHLANERTFLAWFRTGLTLVALGLAAAQFLASGDDSAIPLRQLLATLVIVTGAFLFGVGLFRYRDNLERIDESAFRPASRSIVIATVGAVVSTVVALAFVWALNGP